MKKAKLKDAPGVQGSVSKEECSKEVKEELGSKVFHPRGMGGGTSGLMGVAEVEQVMGVESKAAQEKLVQAQVERQGQLAGVSVGTTAEMAGVRALGASLARLAGGEGPCRLVLRGGVPLIITNVVVILGADLATKVGLIDSVSIS